MNLDLIGAERLPEVVRNEFQRLIARINRVFNADHNPKTGGHSALTWSGSLQTTVGAAGSASALPANPVTYFPITYVDSAGVIQDGVIPVYRKS